MALDIVKLYISLLSEFFMFSDSRVSSPPNTGTEPTPPLLPRDSNSLTTAYQLMKILGEIQDSVNDVNAMEISNEASSSLKGLLESARWKFEDIVTHGWHRGIVFTGSRMNVRLNTFSRRQHSLLPGGLDRIDS